MASDYSLVVNDSGKGVIMTITGKGGDGRVRLDDVTVSGTLKTMSAKNSDLYSTLHVTGAMGKVTLGNMIGVVWSGGAIASTTAGDLTGSFYATAAWANCTFGKVAGTIASGSGVIGRSRRQASTMPASSVARNLGADGLVSGQASAPTTTPTVRGDRSIKVKGAITSSFVGAGVNPVDQTFGNTGDQLVGGTASSIGSITAKSADDAVGRTIIKAKLPKQLM